VLQVYVNKVTYLLTKMEPLKHRNTKIHSNNLHEIVYRMQRRQAEATNRDESAQMSAGIASKSTMSAESCSSALMLISTETAHSMAAGCSALMSLITGSMPP